MDWLVPLWISLKVAFCSSVAVFVVGTAVAYLLALKEFPGKSLLEILVMLPMVLPPTVTGYYLVLAFGRTGAIGRILHDWLGIQLIFSWQGAAVAAGVVSLPLMVQAAKAAIESVDRRFIQVSYTLGHSEWETARRVVLPLAAKGILAGVILAFTRGLGEFGATLMLAGNIPGRTNTMPLEIYSMATAGDWESARLYVIILTCISAVAVLVSRQVSSRRKT